MADGFMSLSDVADDKCPDCGTVLEIGSFPFCPHGQTKAAVISDEIPGGQVFENGFDTPQIFYSHSAHRAALAERGLEIKAKWAGPADRHLSRWDAPCATTLENAKILLTRGKREPEPAFEPIPIEVTTITFERPK